MRNKIQHKGERGGGGQQSPEERNQRNLARLNSKCILENAAKITGVRASPSMLVYRSAMALYR